MSNRDAAIFDYSVDRSDYKSPMDLSRLKAKPWKDATHGRYKDLFNMNPHTPRDRGTRPMRMSPDLDFKVDNKDRMESDLPMSLAQFERKSTKIAREELKKVILKQRITLEKNTKLYKEMRQKLRMDSQPHRTPLGSV